MAALSKPWPTRSRTRADAPSSVDIGVLFSATLTRGRHSGSERSSQAATETMTSTRAHQTQRLDFAAGSHLEQVIRTLPSLAPSQRERLRHRWAASGSG